MTDVGGKPAPAIRATWKVAALTVAALAAALLIAANAHLVYVAMASQPDCVPHARDAGQGGSFIAARSSC